MTDLIGREYPVLNHGHVVLLAYSGSDTEIASAARTSYGGGVSSAAADENLLRYLMRHRHTSPFEMAWLKFGLKLPIFVDRQLIRHRMFSTNEVSARYTVLPDETYSPADERIAEQSTTNKQGSGQPLREYEVADFNQNLAESYSESFFAYRNAIEAGVARELARITLPVGTYTQKVWAGNLHSLLHFLELRLDERAQWEIRQYALAIADIVAELFPATWKAFLDYRVDAITFSKQELILLANQLQGREVDLADLSPREIDEFIDKIDRMKGLL